MIKVIPALHLIIISQQGVLSVIERPKLEVKASCWRLVRDFHSSRNASKTFSNDVERRA